MLLQQALEQVSLSGAGGTIYADELVGHHRPAAQSRPDGMTVRLPLFHVSL
jgi:hypothetical protein